MRPNLSVNPDLPVAAHAEELARAIAAHQVVIVAGETGSGKTTQLPKIALAAGRKRIAHTQPRRIAARTVAARIAEEMGSGLGDYVGFQVRFTRQTSRATRVKVMTDGVLLAELANDRLLRAYDTIIIDEAHERSLNIDFLLGYLKQLLPKRPELRVVVTSATIDTARFSEHFDNAPIIEVSGRTYPVEVRYRPLGEADQAQGVVDAVTELLTEPGGGDVLVFLSGEREIRDTTEALAGARLGVEVLPLYARLSAAEQQRVFAAHAGQRVVLATNVAETSITVPGIRYVVDAGTARISRYSARTKVQRLPIEPISQASANQRAGRCGRLGPGVAIRLYAEDDFAARPEYTEPEILRTNLAMVILQMAQAGLGDIASFPFVEAPPLSQIGDGLRLLSELGALVARPKRGPVRLTQVGRTLAKLPIDPRLGRMLVEAARRDCLREVSVIVAALAIPDVRERPQDKTEEADRAHRRFFADEPDEPPTAEPLRHTVHTGTRKGESKADPSGDFGVILRMWDYLRSERRRLSGNAFRRLCIDNYLNFLRVREWEDMHAQLRDITKELQLTKNRQPAPMTEVLTSVLSGLLSHVGLAEPPPEPVKGRRRPLREYLGARGAKFAIQPGSALQKTTPPLVMAVELVETSRLWARTLGAVTAAQIEAVGAHVLVSTVSEPYWSERSGSVQATERLSLFGIPIVANRRVAYGARNPVEARAIFIQHALVEGQWQTKHAFFKCNEELRAEADERQGRARRVDLVVADEVIYAFYDARIPESVNSTATFDRWWRGVNDEGLLDLSMDDLLVGDLDEGAFPDTWTIDGLELPVSYTFDPGAGHDGVTVTIPVTLLNRIPSEPFTWQVPGLRAETATELLRTLPKSIRTNFVPAPTHAAQALSWLRANPVPGESLAAGLGRALLALTGINVPADAWRAEDIPGHLRVTFQVADKNRQLRGKDLNQIKDQLRARLTSELTRLTAKDAITGAKQWTFGVLPERRSVGRLRGYPALVDEGESVGVQVLDEAARQQRTHALGVRRLLFLTTPDPTRWVVSHMSNTDKVALGNSQYETVPALLADARLKAIDRLARQHGIQVRTPEAYASLELAVRQGAPDEMRRVVHTAALTLAGASRVQLSLSQWPSAHPLRQDVGEQLANLTFNRFISATPDPWFDCLPRYVEGMEVRLEAAWANPDRDAKLSHEIEDIEADFAEVVDALPPGPLPAEVEEVAFLIEELRVSLFAQRLGTSVSVSPKRVRQAIAAIG